MVLVWLIACNPGDAAALWAARRLRRRGLEPLEVVSAEALAYALRIEHRLDAGRPSVRIELADGRRLASECLKGVLNRLTHVPTRHLRLAAEGDRAYAVQEVTALFLSWLSALPGPVLNRPTPFGLPGPCLDRSQWLALATRAGLPAPPLSISSLRPDSVQPAALPYAPCSTIVACGALHGERVPDSTAAACLRLAELSGADILGIELRRCRDGDLAFAGATPLPDLRLGGEDLVGCLLAGFGEGSTP